MHFDIDIHVRYAETDQMGVVYHSNYFPWFEESRTGFFEAIGLAYPELEQQGLFFPLTECGCKFKSPAKYPDWVTVRARLKEFKGVQVVMGYEVFRKADGKLLACGHTAHVFVDREFHPVNLMRTRPDIYKVVMELAAEEKAKREA